MAALIGWVSSAILLATIGTQVAKQWRDRTAQGVSRWLFIGQVTASAGFVTYSVMQGDTVFIFTNTLILFSALIGVYVTIRNKRSGGGG